MKQQPPGIKCRLPTSTGLALLWLLAAVAALAACGGQSDANQAMPTFDASAAGVIELPPGSPMISRIRTGVVERAELPASTISVPARITAAPGRQANVRLPVPGRILSIDTRLGASVAEGDVLMTLASGEAEEAVSLYHQARAALRLARLDAERVRDLHEIDAVPRKELVAAEAELAQAEAEFAFADRQLQAIGLSPDGDGRPFTLRSPLTGRVLHLAAAPGEFVAEPDEVLAVVADLSRLVAIAAVPEHRLADLESLAHAEVAVTAFRGEVFAGRITHVADVLDPETRTAGVHVEIANVGGRLRPGMFGSVTLHGPSAEYAVVPAQSIVYRGSDGFVAVETGAGRFETRRVRVGRRHGDRVSILDGVEPGERVVTEDAILLIGSAAVP